MPSRFNPHFDGEDAAALRDAIVRATASTNEPPHALKDRLIVRAPLLHPMIYMNEEDDMNKEDDTDEEDGMDEEDEFERDDTHPGKNVTKNLSELFAHLRQAALCLRYMHLELGQLHKDVCPRNLLRHYGKNGKIVYSLNDFDSQYPGRLKPEMYGEKARHEVGKDLEGGTPVAVYKNYTYEDMKKHFESISMSREHSNDAPS